VTRRSPGDEEQDLNGPPRAVRHRLPEERASITHKFSIAGHEGYITVGLYPTGQPGEIFIKMAKEGSTVSGLMDAFATSISLALQHGVPLKVLCEKFAHTRFEPSGWTGNEQIGYAKSLMDYIFRWLNLRFLSGTQLTLFAGLAPQAPQLPASPSLIPETTRAEDEAGTRRSTGRLAEEVAKRLNQVSGQPGGQRRPTRGAAALRPRRRRMAGAGGQPHARAELQDRGIYHAADAMREMYDMGDAPSCSV
jgi:ribonucleoside-diphosphate reductase alpha chain